MRICRSIDDTYKINIHLVSDYFALNRCRGFSPMHAPALSHGYCQCVDETFREETYGFENANIDSNTIN